MAESTNTNVVLEAAKNIAAGIPPSNVQIEETLEKAKEVIEEQQRHTMDAQTGIIAQNIKQIITDTQKLLEEKNRDEKLQRFLLEAKLAAEDLAKDVQDSGLQEDAKKDAKKTGKELRSLQEDAIEVLQKAKNVLYEIMRSPSFRRALINAIELFQQVFWDQIQDKGKELSEGLKADLEKGDESMSSTRSAAQNVGERSKEEARRGSLGSLQGEAKKQELKRRLNELLRELGENSDYNSAISDMFDLADKLSSRLEKAGKRLKDNAKQLENVHITNMWQEGKLIIEEFAGHDRIQNIIDTLSELINFIQKDERSKQFFGDLKKYILKGIEEPQRLQTTRADAEDAFDRLYDEGRELFKSEELKDLCNKLIDELKKMIKTARRDPAAERLAESTRALMRDLTIDRATGKPSIWALRDNIGQSSRSILLPILLRELEVVPVPGVRGTTKNVEYAVRNLAFSAYDLLPERARFYMDLDVDVDLTDIKYESLYGEKLGSSTDSDINGEIILRLDGIRTHVRDAQFYYRMLTFPNLEDWGRMDIDTRGKGLCLEVRWRIVSQPGSAPNVMGYRVSCNIDGLDVTINAAAKHELLDRMMSKLFAGSLKDRTERGIERALGTFAGRISLLFNDVFAGRVPSLIPASMAAALPVVSL